MKPFITKLTFCAIFLCAYVSRAKADDYIITTKGDTVKCTFKSRFFSKKQYYKVEGSTEVQQVNEKTVKEYHIDEKNQSFRLVYKTGSTEPYYMNVVENGNICIYEEYKSYSYYNMGTGGVSGSSSLNWYIAKDTNLVVPVKTTSMWGIGDSRKKRKGIFEEMITDKPEVYHQYLADGKFDFDEVQRIVHLYNTGQPYVEPVANHSDDTNSN